MSINRETHYTLTSGGLWSVIRHGLPLCADTDRAGAERTAAHYGLNINSVWLSDRGEFAPLSEVKTVAQRRR